MKHLSLCSFRTVRNIALGTALAAVAVLPTFAATGDPTSATVTGGSLSITTPAAADFSATITGAAQSVNAALATFSVTDATGSGAGWHVTAQASTFTGVGGHNLATGSLSMSAPTITSGAQASADPTVATGGQTIDNAAVQIASAAGNAGMGKYDFSATTMTLALPANVYADTYNSTVTVSAVTAP